MDIRFGIHDKMNLLAKVMIRQNDKDLYTQSVEQRKE